MNDNELDLYRDLEEHPTKHPIWTSQEQNAFITTLDKITI